MNFIVSVNVREHGEIKVMFSDVEKRVLGAWHNNETVELSSKEKWDIALDIVCNRRYSRVFGKAYVANSGFGVFVFPVRSGRFCHARLIEFASQISIWIKTKSSIRFDDDEAIAQGMRIADNASKCKNITYYAGVDSWELSAASFTLSFNASNRIHILDGA
ncbi:TPA: hypothetical protein RMT52_005126 [Escherichia coli]|nr:hypothetical protein [Escherichia coli]HAX1982186.1 hypothetical protein [Escherichia coli]HAX2346757.1 hypothetical protein [Escherichia coli]HBN7237033.1 hypothetical protein [Escherichia coli]HBN7443568.1 hypothetical protein [Escherichia coli]